VLHGSGLAACRASRWSECVQRLDEAKALDPAGDTTPDVRDARDRAAPNLQRK